MDINFLHFALEVSVTTCLLFLSWINFSSAKHGRYSLILGYGALFAGIANALHTVTVSLYPSLEVLEMTAIGSSSQLTLLIMFGLILRCSKRHHCPTWKIILALIVPVIVATMIDAYQVLFGAPISLIDPILSVGLYRPSYMVVAIMWMGVAWAIHNHRNYIFPPYTQVIFFAYVILANVMVSVIPPSMWDLCNMLAHALKLAGYYTFILMYLVSNYRFDICNRINISNDNQSHPIRY